jgi:hypothetical protein
MKTNDIIIIKPMNGPTFKARVTHINRGRFSFHGLKCCTQGSRKISDNDFYETTDDTYSPQNRNFGWMAKHPSYDPK